MYRVEDKYILPKTDFFALRERMAAVCRNDPYSVNGAYTISSLYFDDFRDTDYWDTVSGNPFRKKHRIRIYNDSLSAIKLEVKTKQYSRIAKQSVPITEAEMRLLMNGEPISWGKNREDPKTVFNDKILSEGLRPRVIVTYEREAFLYEAGNVRITFDTRVRASNLTDCFGQAGLIHECPVEDYVLEVKYDSCIPDFLLQLLEIDSMMQSSYSKYQQCRDIYLR